MSKTGIILRPDGTMTTTEVAGLTDLQAVVDGPIELAWVTPSGVDIFCNEEFLYRDPKPNLWTKRMMRMGYHGNGAYGLHGTLLCLRHDNEGASISVTKEDIAHFEALSRGEEVKL